MLYKKFKKAVSDYSMDTAGGIIAAVSGGADSMCLLHLLLRLRDERGIKLCCAHVNHGARETALRDETYVRNFCAENNTDFYLKRIDLHALSHERGISEELCGRDERYKFFNEVCEKTGFKAVYTAHNKNDNAETLLMNLLRGSALRGLCGIPPCRGDGVFRPLVFFERAEILEYLNLHGIKWNLDETNETDNYRRNVIRHHIMPELMKINPSLCDSFLKTSMILRSDEEFMQNAAAPLAARKTAQGAQLFIDSLKSAPAPLAKRAIANACSLAGADVTNADIEACMSLLSKPSGKKHIFPCGCVAIREYDKLFLRFEKDYKDYEYRLLPESKLYIEETGITVFLTEKKPPVPSVKLDYSEKYTVRARRNGDRFVHAGIHKKVKDFLSDRKIPISERRIIPILAEENEIAAVGAAAADSRHTPHGGKSLYFGILTDEKDF